jgi:hypothetical protein
MTALHRTQMYADGPEMVLDFKPKDASLAPFTLNAAQADNFVRDSDSPMFPALQ